MLRTYVSAAMALLALSTVAGAANSNSFVSGSASANNTTCTRELPCQTVFQAVNNTVAGGTVTCLDAPMTVAGFDIVKAIIIDCSAGPVVVSNGFQGDLTDGAAIVINLPAGGLRLVKLIGFHFNGTTGIPNGIRIVSADSVYLEKVTVRNHTYKGIVDARTGGQTRLFIKDSEIHDNGTVGILAAASSVGITVLDNVSLKNNTYGIAVARGNNVAITRSVISANTTAGVEADPGAQLTVSNSVISHNNIGVQAAGGRIRLRENDIEFSNTAIQGSSISMGGNRFSGNGSVGTTPTPASQAPLDVFN